MEELLEKIESLPDDATFSAYTRGPASTLVEFTGKDLHRLALALRTRDDTEEQRLIEPVETREGWGR